MPKIFSEEDREILKHRLMDLGREHFLRFGLRKTRISDLTAEAGIAKGTFYNFFESKEELCLEIFEAEEVGIGAMIRGIVEEERDPRELLRKVLHKSLEFLQGDSLLSALQQSGEYALLGRGVGGEKLAAHQDQDRQLASYLLDALKARGAEPEISPEGFSAVLRAFTMMTFHRREIGEKYFRQATEELADAIAGHYASERKE